MPQSVDITAAEWVVRHDPGDEGVGAGWWMDRARWADGAVPIGLPASWQVALGTEAKGIAWFAAEVAVPPGWGREGDRFWLRFDAVATGARVWIDGEEVGEHVGDYVPFQLELSRGMVERGRLAVVVRVDQHHAPRPAPGILTENGHITKGFHDVLSLQKAGIWERAYLVKTGPHACIPNGFSVLGDPATGRVEVRLELEGHGAGGRVAVAIVDGAGRGVASGEVEIQPGAREVRAALHVEGPTAWEPEHPALYTAIARLEGDGGEPEVCRFGFRRLEVGGREGRRLLLNGRPLLVRGVLHWGHEPAHIAPSPGREQVRAEFRRLKRMGFNCVCLCMVYMAEHYYDIADEEGMLLWQEHPVWKSAMGGAHLAEYRRVLSACFRRDRRHASVAIVSGSCEHESFHPALASWWWEMARRELPDRVAQVQTAFLAWCDPHLTDLHDEHIYDNSGRWVRFVADLPAALAELPARPFVMGETIIGTSWVDTGAFKGRAEWWTARGVRECAAFEGAIAARYSEATLDRFRRQAERANISMRKFQSEVLRTEPACAGWVMNQIRDVPLGRMGFMDDLGRWRFGEDETRPWLADAVLLLGTRDQRRGFFSAADPGARIGVSNFGRERVEGRVTIAGLAGGRARSVEVSCGPGEVAFVPLEFNLPSVGALERVRVRATLEGLPENAWDLWVFPRAGEGMDSVARMDGLPLGAADLEPEFEERAYSSGWGMRCRSWVPVYQHPQLLLHRAAPVAFGGTIPEGTRVVATDRLTRGLVEFMSRGGRVLLFANKSRAALGTKWVCFWGQCPLVPEEGVLGAGESEWVVDLLHHDLSRRMCRAVPSEELGIADRVDPIVRLVFTHDQGRPKLLDSAFVTRVGDGVMLATALDHTEDAGVYLLSRFLRFLGGESPAVRAGIEPGALLALVE